MPETEKPAPLPPNRPPPYGWILVAAFSPLAMLLPPRKMDMRFFFLSGAFSFSSDQVLQHYTGQGIYARTWSRLAVGDGLPEKAQETQRRLLAERARRSGMTVDERKRHEEAQAPKSLWGKLFGAEEGEDWRTKRAQKHEEALREGKGVGDLIVEQVSEVFGAKNEAPKSAEESKEKPPNK